MFKILNGVFFDYLEIGDWNLFGIWDLEFGI
jgi:hypothetical protein